jgi:hypothetical protein
MGDIKPKDTVRLALVGPVMVHSIRKDLPGVYFKKSPRGRLYFALQSDWDAMIEEPRHDQ